MIDSVGSRKTTARGGGLATRERLLDAAMELFARQGFASTSVGAIEQAAGLAPRSGALYQYFASKDELLVAALERKMESLDDLGSALEMLPLGDLRSELRLLARWNLRSLAERDALTRFVLRDAQHVPARLRRRMFERLVERPYAQVVTWVKQRVGPAAAGASDVYALTLIAVESMAAYTTLRTTFGRLPDDIDDDRFVEAWVGLVADAIESAVIRGAQRPQGAAPADLQPTGAL
jgi:AcrR family transcriptional regulator